MKAPAACPVCNGVAALHDTVDFNKSCAESWGVILPDAGVPIDYHLCEACGFCFAPEFARWSAEDFTSRIYNADYATVDPDYAGSRPLGNAGHIHKLFGAAREKIRHLDYGGGAGLLSETLRRRGWQSVSYDPFVNPTDVKGLGTFDLVTAFEVFEHSADIAKLLEELRSLISDGGLLYFSTLLSDGHVARDQRLKWWYGSPRNGHISLFSRRSLAIALKRIGLNLASASPVLHLGFREMPAWAAARIKMRS